MSPEASPGEHTHCSRHWLSGGLVAVCFLFTVSGAAGLIYQVAWQHIFSTIFGNTTYAVSVVIAVFMGGLAIGSHAFGRFADRTRRHLFAFALLQVFIAASGALVPTLLARAEQLYTAVYQATESRALLTLVQAVASAVVLAVPTVLMGGTLPVLSRFAASRRGQVGASVGLLYGLNTLGAAAGAFVAGFVLVKAIGTRNTVYVAATASALVAVGALALEMASGAAARMPAETEGPEAGDTGLGRARLMLLVVAVAVSGFVSFAYEVLWTRLLTFRFETTAFAFSTMLTTFLLGLGLGGAAVGFLRRRPSKAPYWRAFGILEALIGVCGMATILLLFSGEHTYASFAQRTLTEFGEAALIMLVPTTLMGAAFPIACHLFASGVRSTGKSVAGVYVANTVGAVAGALLTGFVLVPAIGTQRTIQAMSLLMVLSGSAIVVSSPSAAGRPHKLRALALPAACCLATVAVLLATPGDFLHEYFRRNQMFTRMHPDNRVVLLGAAEGVEGVVCVTQSDLGDKAIATGSTDVAGTGFTVRTTQKLQAHVPMMVHPDPKSVCQVGFGSGETAYLFTTYDLERFDCVEISGAVLDMADRFFQDINHGVCSSDKMNAIVMDGSTYLKHTARKYDVIANDSIWPHLAGNSALYTFEYFRNGRDHLNPGGIMTSWLPVEMPLPDFKTLLYTFRCVFPNVYVWSTLSHHNKHALLIGSLEPIAIDAARFADRFDRYAKADLAHIRLDDQAVFLCSHLAEIRDTDLDFSRTPLNTEDLPVLQFLSSRPEYFRQRGPEALIDESLRLLAAHRSSVTEYLTGVDKLPDGAQLVEHLHRLDRAGSLILRAAISRFENPALNAMALQAAEETAPEHPYFSEQPAPAAGAPSTGPIDARTMTVDEIREMADDLRGWGLYAQALGGYQEWVARQPDSYEARLGLGRCYLALGRFDLAANQLTRATRLAPDEPEAFAALGLAYRDGQRLADALPCTAKAVELDPDNADLRTQLGTLYAVTGETDAALVHLAKAVELDPLQAGAYTNLGVLLVKNGDYTQAIAPLARALDLRPDSIQACRSLGLAYAETGRPDLGARLEARAEMLMEGIPTAPSSSQ